MAIRLANSIKDIAAVCKLTMHFESTNKVASKTQLESADLTVYIFCKSWRRYIKLYIVLINRICAPLWKIILNLLPMASQYLQ